MVQSSWLNNRAAVLASFGATNAHTRSSCAAAWAEAVITITRTSKTPHHVPTCQCAATHRGINEWAGLKRHGGRGLGTRGDAMRHTQRRTHAIKSKRHQQKPRISRPQVTTQDLKRLVIFTVPSPRQVGPACRPQMLMNPPSCPRLKTPHRSQSTECQTFVDGATRHPHSASCCRTSF